MSAGQVQYNGLANITSGWTAYASFPKYCQWGTGSGAARSANALNSTTGTTEARTSGTVTQQTVNQTNDTAQVVALITELSTGPIAITEVGLFDAAGTGSPPTGGNMDVYGSFAAVNVYAGDSISFTIQTTFS